MILFLLLLGCWATACQPVEHPVSVEPNPLPVPDTLLIQQVALSQQVSSTAKDQELDHMLQDLVAIHQNLHRIKKQTRQLQYQPVPIEAVAEQAPPVTEPIPDVVEVPIDGF